MRRLTSKTVSGKWMVLGKQQEAIDLLAHYEDLEEQGRLVVLPCAVGADAWYVLEMFGEICKATIAKIELNSFTNPQIWFTVVYHSRCIGDQEIKARADFMLGKTVFLSRTEAEAALAASGKEEECYGNRKSKGMGR